MNGKDAPSPVYPRPTLQKNVSIDDATIQIQLRKMKSVDEDRFTYRNSDIVQMRNTEKYKSQKSDRIKLASIYDDEQEIIRILSQETRKESIQELLSMKDKRGQPCIFYALESRSDKALKYLLNQLEHEDSVIAYNGESVLHVATRMGDVHILKTLLSKDLVAKLVDHVERENGRAPLHIAATFNHVEIAKELLVHGARLDREDVTGKTPIFMAASRGHASMLKAFLQHGHKNIENLMLNNQLFGLMYDNLLQVAVDSGDEETVHVCLEQDQEIVRHCLRTEITHGQGGLIHSACKNGMENCVLKIVECMGKLEKVHFSRKDRHGFTPIHKAAIHNHPHLVKYIGSISRTFVNQTTQDSQTALILASANGHIKVVEELLNLKAEFQTTDDSGRSVLHYAIKYPEIVRLLVKQNDVARLLINAKEKDGYTPVHNAALKGLCESLNILLEYGADMNVFTNTSRSPLHCAVSSQCVDAVQLVLSNEPALVNKADATGKTPLHTAASYGSVEVVRRLFEHDALIVRDDNMYSPLHIAALKGHLEVVELLVATNPDIIHWKNKYGRTALIAAASTGKTKVVKFLLDNGSCITEDHEFFNCLDWCMIRNDHDTAMALMTHSRWTEILNTTRHGAEGTMAKLVYKMPEVAHRVLSNSITTQGHPDSKEHVKRYDFLCLQSRLQDKKQSVKIKPLAAIKTMVSTKCYNCLCHPVSCKFLKVKWMEFGWKVHSISLLFYIVFLISLNVYAFKIPTYKETLDSKEVKDVSANVKLAMIFCLIFTSVNALKEITQVVFYRHRYFADKVNYLECVLFVCVFIFAVPTDNKINVKTSLQWKACSVALFLAWINLVLYLRRFASYGIYVLMMKRISGTLIKVLSLLIFFFVAFAAAFTVIMNDKQGFTNFGISMLTSATMTMGEFDFKETFLDEENEHYDTFLWLRLAHFVAFVIVMPIILMNLVLALAIDDTNSIMQQAKLTKHIHTAKMIIEMERKRSIFFWRSKPKMVSVLEERPNKRVNLLRQMWEYLVYGPDLTSDESMRTYDEAKLKDGTEVKIAAMVDMMKSVQEQMTMLQQELTEIKSAGIFQGKHPAREQFPKEKRNASTQFRGHSESFDDFSNDDKANPWTRRRRWLQNLGFGRTVSEKRSEGVDPEDIVFVEEQDVKDEKDRERNENDPELKELKELHSKTPLDEYDGRDGWSEDSEDEESTSKVVKLFQRAEDAGNDDQNKNLL